MIQFELFLSIQSRTAFSSHDLSELLLWADFCLFYTLSSSTFRQNNKTLQK